MKNAIEGFMNFCSKPLSLKARPVLVLLALSLALSFAKPLWHVRMVAPQYPQGLDLYVSTYKVDGGHEGRDVHEINTLNHYIGMRPIDRAGMKDLDWLPFAFGLLVLLALRVAAIGDVRSLIDLAVVTVYVSVFALARFVLQLWSFGHDLNPEAPFHVEPFMPVVIGHKQIANFTTEAWPGWGSAFIGVFAIGVLALTTWQLWSGRRAARAKARA